VLFEAILSASSRVVFLQKALDLLRPTINMHILLSVLHTFVMELIRGICLHIRTSFPWRSLSLLSSLDCLNK